MRICKILLYLIIFGVLSVFLLSLNDIDDNFWSEFDYSGTNSLFIEYEGKRIKFNWITNQIDSGYYQIKAKNNAVIKEGFTSNKRVHQTIINTKIADSLTFRFGGKKSKKQSITLYPKPKLEKTSYDNVDSIYVVGDIHGAYNRLINLLENSNVIDNNLNWIAGKSHLVFLGDILDRGNKVTKTLWFIYELEQQAKRHGGKVHLVLGNHETMVMSKDLRYVSRKEKNISIAYGVNYDYLFHPKKSVIGNWLKSKTSVLKIDDILFAHGGIIDLNRKSLRKFNKQAHKFINHPAFLDLMEDKPNTNRYTAKKWKQIKSFFYGENSPYWYRDYVLSDTLNEPLSNILKKYNAKIHIVGHTSKDAITKKYQGQLITTSLTEKATQLLLLVKNDNTYRSYYINSEGKQTSL